MKRPPPNAQWFRPAIARRTAARITQRNGRPLVLQTSHRTLCAWRGVPNASKSVTAM